MFFVLTIPVRHMRRCGLGLMEPGLAGTAGWGFENGTTVSCFENVKLNDERGQYFAVRMIVVCFGKGLAGCKLVK